jgi:hypothetical protein
MTTALLHPAVGRQNDGDRDSAINLASRSRAEVRVRKSAATASLPNRTHDAHVCTSMYNLFLPTYAGEIALANYRYSARSVKRRGSKPTAVRRTRLLPRHIAEDRMQLYWPHSGLVAGPWSGYRCLDVWGHATAAFCLNKRQASRNAESGCTIGTRR